MASQLTHPLPRSWWLRKATYLSFVIRELTSLAVLAYALFLIWLLFSASSEASFTGLVHTLQSGWSVALHAALGLLALYHTITWVLLTPKVLVLWQEDDQVEPDLIAGLNYAAWLAVSGLVIWLVLR